MATVQAGATTELVIVSLADASNPQVMATLDLGVATAETVHVHDAHAYITARTDGVLVVDLRDLSNPAITVTADDVPDAFDSALVGETLLVGNVDQPTFDLAIYAVSCR